MDDAGDTQAVGDVVDIRAESLTSHDAVHVQLVHDHVAVNAPTADVSPRVVLIVEVGLQIACCAHLEVLEGVG